MVSDTRALPKLVMLEVKEEALPKQLKRQMIS